MVKATLLTILALFRKIEIKLALMAVMVLSLIPMHFGRYERVAGAIADAGHFWFYLTAYLYLNRVVGHPKKLLVGLILISGAIEFIQPFVDRDGNFQDFTVSSLGAACGYLVFTSYPILFKLAAIVVCSTPLFFPIYGRYDALRYQESLFPEFANFKDNQWASLWEATSPDKTPSSTLYLTSDRNLAVRAIAGKEWPGVVYLNQFLSWNHFQALEFEVESFGASQISLRIDDDGDCKEFNDRFNGSFLLKEGKNQIRVPLEEVRMTKSGRMMNLEKIKRVALFTTSRERPERVFALIAMRLVK